MVRRSSWWRLSGYTLSCLLTGIIVGATTCEATGGASQIKGKVSLSDGRTVAFSMFEGARLTIWDGGTPYSLVAEVLDAAEEKVRFEVSHAETGSRLGELEVKGGHLTASSQLAASFAVEVLEVVDSSALGAAAGTLRVKPACIDQVEVCSDRRLVVGHVEMAGGGIVRFKIPEGETVKVSDPDTGRTLVMNPTILDEETLDVNLDFVDFATEGPAPKQLRSRLNVQNGLPMPLDDGVTRVSITEVRTGRSLPTGEALTFPKSSRQVHARLVIPGDRKVDFSVREGELFTISDGVAGYNIGLAPDIIDEAAPSVSFRLYELTKYGPQLEGLELAGQFVSTKGKLSPLPLTVKGTELRVEVLSITHIEVSSCRDGREGDLKSAGGTQCCVECPGDKKSCGCKVKESCGECCVDPCCDT